MSAAGGLLVIGAGGHAKVIVAALVELGESISAVVDADPSKWGKHILGHPVTRPDTVPWTDRPAAILGIGDNATRRRLSDELDCRWRTVVDPSATVHRSVEIGEGAFIAAGAVIQPDARIGPHAIVNTGATVDHDCVLGAFYVAPGAHLAGGVAIGEGTLVGIGASVKPYLTIGSWVQLGAGAAAVHEIPDGAIAVGVPARVRDDG